LWIVWNGVGVSERLFRSVVPQDIDRLLEIEEICFSSDRLSRRSFQRWIKGDNSILQVLEVAGQVRGYGLVLLNKGTRLARLYSIALHPSVQGQGHASALMLALEAATVEQDRLFMRLEVATQNLTAVQLYQRLGYQVFGEFSDYYEDHSDALRMQKRIRYPEHVSEQSFVPWYRQNTAFTCGPASLMMVMAAIDPEVTLNQSEELDLWREATTIFMTSGHGGCHPLGLALAAERRGFYVEVQMSQTDALFLEGVRAAHKKEVLNLVHEQFLERSEARKIPIRYEAVTVAEIELRLSRGEFVMVLISSYRLNGDKAPHWVVVTASDELCFYLHDPDTDKLTISELDCQYIPVAKEDFAKMINYGRNRFSAALFFKKR
jgi:ribosomal protein S18 acetylase RimI-like enzyme